MPVTFRIYLCYRFSGSQSLHLLSKSTITASQTMTTTTNSNSRQTQFNTYHRRLTDWTKVCWRRALLSLCLKSLPTRTRKTCDSIITKAWTTCANILLISKRQLTTRPPLRSWKLSTKTTSLSSKSLSSHSKSMACLHQSNFHQMKHRLRKGIKSFLGGT